MQKLAEEVQNNDATVRKLKDKVLKLEKNSNQQALIEKTNHIKELQAQNFFLNQTVVKENIDLKKKLEDLLQKGNGDGK